MTAHCLGRSPNRCPLIRGRQSGRDHVDVGSGRSRGSHKRSAQHFDESNLLRRALSLHRPHWIGHGLFLIRIPAAWKRDRMTWIKPSFLWMMYRCGWGTKEGQETVLAVEIRREGFDWALRNACLSHYVRSLHENQAAWKRELKRAPARVQWDPERDLRLRPLPYRSLQLGLSGEASRCYADEWTVAIRDVTPLVHEVHSLVRDGDLDSAARLLPQEGFYTGQDELIAHLQG